MPAINEKRVIYILLCLGCFTISFNVAAIAAVIPAISKDLNLPDFHVAQMIPYYLIPYGLGALISAPLTRCFSYRWILSLSLGIYAVSCCLCASVNHLPYILLGRAGMGIAAASVIPLGLILIGQLYESKVRGRRVGLFFSLSFVASVIGLAVSGLANWRWLFTLPAMLALATALCFWILKLASLDLIRGLVVNYIKTLGHPAIAKIFAFIAFMSFLYHGVHQWYGVYLDHVYHLDQLKISALFFLIAVSGALGQLMGGLLTDKISRYAACSLGLILLSVFTIVLGGRYPLWFLALVLGMISLGWTIGHNGVSTVLTDFPEEYRPEIASLNSSVRFIAGGVGFWVSSLFVERSFSGTFLGIGLGMLSLLFFLKKIIPPHKV